MIMSIIKGEKAGKNQPDIFEKEMLMNSPWLTKFLKDDFSFITQTLAWLRTDLQGQVIIWIEPV